MAGRQTGKREKVRRVGTEREEGRRVDRPTGRQVGRQASGEADR